MSNPYAPPEDRPHTDGGPVPPPVAPPPVAPPAGQPAPWTGDQVPAGPPRAPVPTEPVREQRPPDPDGLLLTARRARTVAVLFFASVLVATLPLPWQAASALFAVAAFALGIRAFVTSVRARARGGLPAMLTLLVGASAMWSFVCAGMLLLWPLQAERQECMAGALTVSAQQRCEEAFKQGSLDFERSLRERSTQG